MSLIGSNRFRQSETMNQDKLITLTPTSFFACIIALCTHFVQNTIFTKISFFSKPNKNWNEVELRIILRMKLKSKHFNLGMKWHPLVNLFKLYFDTVKKSVTLKNQLHILCFTRWYSLWTVRWVQLNIAKIVVKDQQWINYCFSLFNSNGTMRIQSQLSLTLNFLFCVLIFEYAMTKSQERSHFTSIYIA